MQINKYYINLSKLSIIVWVEII